MLVPSGLGSWGFIRAWGFVLALLRGGAGRVFSGRDHRREHAGMNEGLGLDEVGSGSERLGKVSPVWRRASEGEGGSSRLWNEVVVGELCGRFPGSSECRIGHRAVLGDFFWLTSPRTCHCPRRLARPSPLAPLIRSRHLQSG